MEETPTIDPLPTAPAPPPIAPPTPKRLRRRTDNKFLGGVCSGIADYFGIDPIAVRVIAVLLALPGGFGVLAYLIAWALVPAEDGSAVVDLERTRKAGSRIDLRFIAGLALLGFGAMALLDAWDVWWAGDVIWPGILLAAGAVLLFWNGGDPKARRRGESR